MFKSTTLIFTVAIAFYVTPIHAQQPQGVNLAEMQDWNIVIADDAIASEVYAAEEFQEFFSQASGLKLPIVHKITRWDKHVFIGPGKVMHASPAGFSVDDFGEEELRIVIRDGNIAIAGGRPRGTLYGVYTFLEDYLGVRFLTHDHIHVPQIGTSRIVGPIDKSYQPPLDYRNVTYGENRVHPQQGVRLRQNTCTEDPTLGGKTSIININHSFYRQVPGSWGSQPCLSDPKVLDMVIQAVKKELEERPDAQNVQVAQNDGGSNYCTCEQCTATDEREESHMGSLLIFVNAVADEIVKTHPNVKIGTLAYNYSQKPPKNIEPRPNVQIQLCSVPVSPLYAIGDPGCGQNEGFRQALAAWSRICDDIGIWNYNLNHWNGLLPNPNMDVVESNIRFFVANNVRRVFMQSPSGVSTEFSDLKNYVTCRLAWNPELNGRQLRNEFLHLHYGEAAGPIRDYLDLLHDRARINTESKPWVSFCGRADNFGIDDKVIQAGLEAFEEALELAGDDKVLRSRVEKASIAAYCAAASQACYWGSDNGYSLRPDQKSKPKIPADLAMRTRPHTRRFFELCDEYGVTFWGSGDVNEIQNVLAFFKRIYGLKEDESL